jgi:hypothetical protein
MSTGIVASIKAASWYPSVEAVMSNAGVPDYLWMGIIASEDGSLNTTQATPDYYTSDHSFAGYSYGLFQLNQNPSGTDPVYSAKWAASKLVTALSTLPSDYTPQQALAAAEQAAWPGMANPPDAASRLSNMNSVIAQLGGTNLVPASTALTTPAAQSSNSSSSSSSGPQTLWDWLTQTGPADLGTWLQGAAQNTAVVLVALVVLAAGLWFLGSGMVGGVSQGAPST